MGEIWIIPDVHGAGKTLLALLDRIAPTKSDTIYFLGDLVDRGPESKLVLETVEKLKTQTLQTRVCMGNHELATLKAKEDMAFYRSWLQNFGGLATLASFSVASIQDVPQSYMNQMAAFEPYIFLDDYLLIHAGLDFSLEDPFSDESAFYHIRKFDVDREKIGGRRLIHGHTPTKLVEIMLAIETGSDRIPLDNGAVYTGSQVGNLLAYNPLTQNVIVQPYIG